MKKTNYTLLTLFSILLASNPALAGKWHSATKPTQEEAMQAATQLAIKRAKQKNTCYKPSWAKQVINSPKRCTNAEGGVTCWATSADRWGSCENGKYGWLWAKSPQVEWEIPPVPVYPELPSLPRFERPKP